ncbi:phosphotransferase [Nocardia sp. CDC159]|uniref:Phosphotransferase n=1 Tax=Nocardia pulmonis TaxID=2951408 RepID=A0A9X2E1A3_9NOCA|nr:MULTISPECIES: phosphotransferase [Nocardia]MCM6772362.1 phosphotransferase [Nocardia pulmonis]MCM6784980.1 phosphotransferase [Nocardia sp. CDC159]
MEIGRGWDSVATLVDGWVWRRAQRAEIVPQLLRETRIMPWLAPRLPLPVPVPEPIDGEPFAVRHRMIAGAALAGPTAAHGMALGAFLRALHDCPVGEALRHGLSSAERTRANRAADVEEFRDRVVPLLPSDIRPRALELLDTVAELPADTVVHGDLGPEHILADADGLTGIIDFGDAQIGDSAIDLAWALYGTPPAFRQALAASYGVTDAQRERALVWHRLGPWHEVTFGQLTSDDELIDSGVAGVIARLTDTVPAG